MKPDSIRRFDMFFLASLALLVLGFVLNFDNAVTAVQAEASGRNLQVGGGFTVAVFAVVLVIDLVLWFLVSRKRLAFAKWVLVVLLVLDLVGVPALLRSGMTPLTLLSLLRIALETVALGFLFRGDARAWLAGISAEESPDPEQPA